MLHRLSILMILASWLFAWFSASVHVHTPGHDCRHDVAESAPHSHAGGGHCHSHGSSAHKHTNSSEQPDETGTDDLPSISGECPLCDLIALELATAPFVDVASAEVLIAEARLLRATVPASAARYSLRGRAPPAC